jgi:predicted GNAT superfamily acetyltransferase
VVLDMGAGGDPLLAGLAAWAGTTAARADRALARIPDDILAVRSRDRRQADAWRGALREVMTTLFAQGLRPVGAFAPGWYVFGPDGSDWPA